MADDWVSASEIGAYEYCARAYWLERVRGIERTVGVVGRLARGIVRHAQHGRRVAMQQWLVRVAIVLLIAAALIGAGAMMASGKR